MNYEERISDLERRVKELEEAAQKQFPWPLPSPWVGTDDQNEVWPKPTDFPDYIPNKWPVEEKDESQCPKCKMIWKGVMGYCCPDHKCPMGAGPTMI